MQETCINQEAGESPESVPEAPRLRRGLAGIAFLLLLVASPLIYSSAITFYKGERALQYARADASIAKVEDIFEAFSVRKEASVRFTVNGAEKSAVVNVPSERILKKGELTNVYFDTDNPAEAVLSQQVDYDSIIVKGAFGLFVLSFALLTGWEATKGLRQKT